MTEEENKEMKEFLNKAIEAVSIVIEKRLTETLGSRLIEHIRPLNESAIDILRVDLDQATLLLNAVNNSLLGWWAIKRTKKKLLKGTKNEKK